MAGDSPRVEGNFPIYFKYTVGLAGERFLREIKDKGKLLASRCPTCDLNYLPPRAYCERCLSALEEYVAVESVGTVDTFTVCRLDAHGKEMAEPVIVAFVKFPNTHGGLVHRVKGDVSIGDKVRVVFREKPKRTGSILDIEYFEKST